MSKQWILLGSGAALGGMALIATIVWLTFSGGTSRARGITYQTGIGEQRTVGLADGSTIELDSDTWVHVLLDGDTRDVTLTRGNAYFTVAGETRPFRIVSGTAKVTTPGGAFEMRVNTEGMVISVEQGRVAVSPKHDGDQRKELTALQELIVTRQQFSDIQELSELEADWRDGWLEFEDEALSVVVAELDKYYRGTIRLREEVPPLRVSARFRIADIDKAIRVLAKSMKLEISIADSGDITLAPQEE